MSNATFNVAIGRCVSRLLLSMSFIFLSLAPLAAEQVGTAIVNGRMVILDSDNTWRFQEEAEGKSESGCDKVKGIEVCVKSIGWKTMPTQGDYAALYSYSGKYYFGILIEPYGKKDGVNFQALQRAIVENAARFTSVTPNELPVLATETEVKGVSGARSVTYSPTMNGTPLVFHNIFKIYPDKSIQMVFWGIGKTMTPEFQETIKKALAQIKGN